jgi:hypothetical protein
MHIRFLTRLTLNNLSDCLAAHLITLSGRAEIRVREIGYSTQDTTAGNALPSYDRRCDLKAYTVRNSNYDETLAILAQLMVNTIHLINPGGSTLDLVATEGSDKQETAENEEDSNVVEMYNQVLIRLSCLSDEARMAVDPYAPVYEPAINCVTDLGEKLEFDLEMVRVMMNTWFFGSPRYAPFLLDPTALGDTDQIWHVPHRHDRWSKFSELTWRFVSCSTSESWHCKRISQHSMEHNSGYQVLRPE